MSFEDGKVVTTDPVAGEEIDADAAEAAITDAYLAEDAADVELELRPAEPEIDEADVQKALDEFANPAMSGPVTLVFGDSPVQLYPDEFGEVLAMEAENGELVPSLDEKALTKLVDDGISEDGAPVDATVELVDGKPKVVPAKPGVTYDPADVSAAFLELVTKPGDEREMPVEATVVEPEFTTADARALKIKEQVSTFTTYYPYAEYRNINIGRAAEIIDGTVLKPGDDVLAERHRRRADPRERLHRGLHHQQRDLQGGPRRRRLADGDDDVQRDVLRRPEGHRAQAALVLHRPLPGRPRGHRGLGLGRPAVRERHAVRRPRARDRHAEHPVHAGRRHRVDVLHEVLEHHDARPRTATTTGRLRPARWTPPDCYPNEGYSGFDVDVERIFRKPGSDDVVRTENFHTAYTPSDTVICKPPKG